MGQADQITDSKKQRYHVIPRSLVFVRQGDALLLLKGAPTKRIWANKFNGVGGHIEVDEDIRSGARREIKEETGLDVTSLWLAAIANINTGSPALGIMMFVFMAEASSRDTVASQEGSLHWINVDSLDSLPLVDDLSWLIPRLAGRTQRDEPLFLQYRYNAADQLVIYEDGAGSTVIAPS